MLQLFRIVLFPLLCVLSVGVQANSFFRDCPSGTAATSYVNVHTIDLSGGEIRGSIGAPGEQLSLLLSTRLPSDSGCEIEAEVQYYNGLGAPVGEPQSIRLNATTQFQELLSSYSGSAGVREVKGYRAHGTLTGCTVEEASNFAVTESQLDATGQARTSDADALTWFLNLNSDEENDSAGVNTFDFVLTTKHVFGGSGDAGTPNYIATTESQQREVDLDCQAAASGHKGVAPLDTIWDVFTGSTTQQTKNELLIFVTPRILRCERRDSDGRAVDFLPKVNITVRLEDSLGNRFMDTVEVYAESPSAVLSYPYMVMGERVHQSVQLTAKMPSCQTGRPYDMDVKLYQVDDKGQTLTSRTLGGVRYKVPPPQFEYNGDGTVEP
jgi:hypothetical protein